MPTSGGITQARQRLGPEPLAELFAQVAVPVADAGHGRGVPGAVAADGASTGSSGTSRTPRRTRPRSGTRAGGGRAPAAFPKVRVVTISECASHAAVLAAIGPAAAGRAAASRPWPGSCYPRLEEDWLLIADRNFY